MATQRKKQLAVLRLSAIGDACHVVPLLHSVQQDGRFAIDWYLDTAIAPLFASLPHIRIRPFDKSHMFTALRQLARARIDYDVLLHVHPSFRANCVGLFLCAKERIGLARNNTCEKQWHIHTHASLPHTAQKNRHVVDSYLAVLDCIAVKKRFDYSLPLTDTAQAFARKHIAAQTIAINLAASPAHPEKTPDCAFWQAIIAHCRSMFPKSPVCLLGTGKAADAYSASLLRMFGDDAALFSLVGKTSVDAFAACIARSMVCITPDSAAVHIADLCNTPCVSLFCATNPKRTGPYRNRRGVVDGYSAARRALLSPHAHWHKRIYAPCTHFIQKETVIRTINRLMTEAVRAPHDAPLRD